MARTEIASLSVGLVLSESNGTLRAASGAQVYVYEHATSSPATVYQAGTGESTLTQPLSTNTQGVVPGWVQDTAYLDFEVVANSETQKRIVNLGAGIAAVTKTITGTGALKKFTVAHSLGTLTPTIFYIREKGHAGSEAIPGSPTLIKETKVLNANEIEAVFETAPANNEVYWVQVTG